MHACTWTRVIFGVYSDTRQSAKHQAVLQRTRLLRIVVGRPDLSVSFFHLLEWIVCRRLDARGIDAGIDRSVSMWMSVSLTRDLSPREIATCTWKSEVPPSAWPSVTEIVTVWCCCIVRDRRLRAFTKSFPDLMYDCCRANNLWAITGLIGAAKSSLRISLKKSKDWTHLRSL